MYIVLKDAVFNRDAVAGIGRVTLPINEDTDAFAISIYVFGQANPVVVTYENIIDRDNDYSVFVEGLTYGASDEDKAG